MQGRRGPRAPVVAAQEPFDAFFRREAPGVLAVALALAGSDWVARELVLDAFLRVRREWDHIGRERRPDAWVRRIVARKALSRWRRVRVRARSRLGLAPRAEPQAGIWSEVGRLPKLQAQIFALTHLEGLGPEAVAAVLETAPGIVRMQVARATRSLEERLGLEEPLEEVAAEAAKALRVEAASQVGSLDVDAHAERHRRVRIAIAIGTLAAVGLFVAVGSVIRANQVPGEEPLPAFSIPPSSATTAPAVTTIPTEAAPGRPARAPPSVLGAGWEELDFGPLTGGRFRMATAWIDAGLFVFGGHVLESQAAPPSSEFLEDGYLLDAATGEWSPTGPPPPDVCHLGQAQAIPVLDGVVLLGSTSVLGDGCARAALYRPRSDDWITLRGELFDRASSRTVIVSTGDLLVAPMLGLSYRFDTGVTSSIPATTVSAGTSSPVRAFWTGELVVAVGASGIETWAPGEEAWAARPDAPVPTIARDSVWAGDGLWVVNYQMAAARYDFAEWARPGDLPLRFYECLPEAAAAGNAPVVRMCSGIAVWDDVGGFWMPYPLEDLTGNTSGALVAADDAVYSVGRRLRRLPIHRRADGSIVPPPTVPIGVMQLDLPAELTLVGSSGANQPPDGSIPDDEFIALYFDGSDPERTCTVASGFLGDEPIGHPVSVLEVPRVRSRGVIRVNDLSGAGVTPAVFAVPDSNGSDVIYVECDLYDDALVLVSGLWSPGEPPAQDTTASLVVTPAQVVTGTAFTMYARDFPPFWGSLSLVDESGLPVVEIPTDIFPHHPEFEFTVSVDVSVGGLIPVPIPPGTYRFALDGSILASATITKVESVLPEVGFGRVAHDGGIFGTVEVVNSDGVPVDVSGWSIGNEVPPFWEFTLPEGSVLAPGENLVVEVAYAPACFSGPGLRVCADPPVRPYDSVVLRDSGRGRFVVDRVLLAGPCPRPLRIDVPCDRTRLTRSIPGVADVSFEIPVDGPDFPVGPWQIADFPLTPNLGIPELLTVSTYPLRPGAGDCARVPQFALEDLGRFDVLISVQRRGGGWTGVPRPNNFSYTWLDAWGADSFFAECLDRVDRFELYIRFVTFEEDGIAYHLLVALGTGTEGTVRHQQVLDILDSLELSG